MYNGHCFLIPIGVPFGCEVDFQQFDGEPITVDYLESLAKTRVSNKLRDSFFEVIARA